MNKMKQLIFVTIGFIVAALVIGGTLMSVQTDIKNQVESGKNNSSQSTSDDSDEDTAPEIVFIKIIDKYNRGKRSGGYVIDRSGLRYDFDFSGKTSLTHEEILAEVEKKIKDLNGEAFVSENDMSTLYDMVNKIKDIEFSIEENVYAEDATTLYGVVYKNNKPNLIKIYSSGSVNESPLDYNAKSIRKFIVSRERDAENKTESSGNVSVQQSELSEVSE